jgi:hypothetical protein
MDCLSALRALARRSKREMTLRDLSDSAVSSVCGAYVGRSLGQRATNSADSVINVSSCVACRFARNRLTAYFNTRKATQRLTKRSHPRENWPAIVSTPGQPACLAESLIESEGLDWQARPRHGHSVDPTGATSVRSRWLRRRRSRGLDRRHGGSRSAATGPADLGRARWISSEMPT